MKFDDMKKLHQKKYRHEFGHFLVEGQHLVQELEKAALGNPALQGAKIFATADYQDWPTDLEKNIITEKQMAPLSDTKTPQGIVALVPTTALNILQGSSVKEKQKGKQRAIYLYEVQDPGNLGTVLRTLAWFSGFDCLLSANSVDPFNAKVIRASMGAIFHVSIEQDVSMEMLAERFQHVACLEVGGDPLPAADFHQSDCLVFGNEARGIPPKNKTSVPMKAFGIPGGGGIDSLNMATAVSLSVYEMVRGREN